ncbi:hypothetical protein [Granulicella sp. dw_53]|uniref:hypothetical protein n=1 Tax=Granulicella sp. dw_53 TaxID=2719792 RepID=UPI001BD445A1|nr:hypothetical protein [Granulicella sp. dw_53]
MISMLQLWFVANTVLWPFIVKVGGFSLGLNVVVFLVSGTVWIGKDWRIALASAKVLLAFVVYVFLSFLVASAGPCNDHLQKFVLTMPILLFLVLIGLEVGNRATDRDWFNLQRTASWVLVVAFGAFFVEMILPNMFPDQAGYRAEGKLSGLFSEPSHVAFSLFPCIAILLVAKEKSTRQKGMMALAGLLALSRSSTLIVFIAVWIIYRLYVQRKVRQAVIASLGIGLLIALGATINYDRFIMPTLTRIMGVAAPGDDNNVSSLVYLQGWQDALFNLQRTHGIGLGLNMMGCVPLPDVPARYALGQQFGLDGLNAEDGSFMFSKIVSEAGVGGIVLYVWIIWWWIQLEKRLRHYGKHGPNLVATTQTALIFCFVASSFIRSANYFNGGFLLWIATIAGASKWKQNPLLQPRLSKISSTPRK